ncbi:MAG: autotransporter domain-containing protein, partial [Thermoguttaceae bacterium]|nr:autotransporter domain-containing protein [Thermoguttaceae bacterium]
SNRVDSDTVTTYANGATQLTAAGANTITDSAILNYSLVSGLANGWYLAGVGNFSGLDDFILLANQDDYAKSVKTVNSNGVWFGTLYYGSVYRYDNPGELQNTALTFDGAFGDGLQALATGDSIRIGGDVNSENEVTIGEGVTELSISSAAAGGVPVTVTATGNDHRFLNVEGDLTLNLTKVGFTGGKATNEENATGGALYAADGTTLTIHSDNAVFSNNTANFGGAIESNELALTGTSAFSENAANYEGGAIDTWTSTISGEHTFTNNSASERGGAIWAQELIFTGDNSNVTFSGNTAAGTANDIWIAGNGMAGLLTIEGDGTYELNGGIVAKNGSTLTINDSADVTFASHAVNNISGLTTINSNHVSFGDETTNTFAGGLALGAGVNQAVGGNVTVGNLLGVTYDATNETISQISFANVSSLTVDQGTKALISDTNGNTLTAKDFRGKLLGTTSFILGKTGGTELATVAGGDAYESLLYKVQIGYGLDDSTNYVMKSEEKQLDVDAIEGNARAARSLFGNGLFDVQTVEEARRNVSGATGELYASTATAQTNRLNYLNTMLANRLQQQNGETISSDSTVRGQSPSACCPKDSTSCRRLTNLWGSGYGIGGFASMGSNNVTGYDYSAGGMLIGADWQSSMADMGLFYGYGQTNIDSFASGLDSKDHTFGGYLKWDSLALGGYTTVLGDFSFSDAKGTRNYNGQGYRGDFDSMQSSVYLERGWKYQNGFGVNINPYAVLQYIGYNADEFSDGVLTVGDVNYESLRTKAGLRVDKDFCRNGNLWNLSTSFAWNHELLDTNADFVATTNFGGQAVSATIFGNNAGRDWFEYTAGAKVALTENVTLSGDYFLYVNERSTL